MSSVHEGILQYSWDEVIPMVEAGEVQWIDVRTPEEYEAGHAPGIPLFTMQEIDSWADKLDPNQPYVFVCRSGGRSQNVAKLLQGKGFANVANCEGGTLAYPGELTRGMAP